MENMFVCGSVYDDDLNLIFTYNKDKLVNRKEIVDYAREKRPNCMAFKIVEYVDFYDEVE